MVGITGYGTYVPKYRIKLEDIAAVWQKSAADITSALKVTEKAVPSFDEDSVTMGIEASRAALQMAGIEAQKIESVYFGSESHPYTVNPSSTIVADFLGVGNNYMAADFEFACKAATAAVQLTSSAVQAGKIEYGLVIGSDTAQAKPHDVLEYTAASAACAVVIGNKKSEVIAEIIDTLSFSSDTPDFWRRDGVRYPSHFGRFTGEPAYFTHVMGAAKRMLAKSGSTPENYTYCVFHMPNGKFPRVVAKKLGFGNEQLSPSLTVDAIGNPYSASSLVGLSAVLDIAKPGDKIFFVSYGSGAGSDAFIFKVTENITKKKNPIPFSELIREKQYISYIEYLKQTHKI